MADRPTVLQAIYRRTLVEPAFWRTLIHATCSSACRSPCVELHMDVTRVCGACFGDGYRCQLGAAGFADSDERSTRQISLVLRVLPTGRTIPVPVSLPGDAVGCNAPPLPVHTLVIQQGAYCIGNGTATATVQLDDIGLYRFWLPGHAHGQQRIVFDGRLSSVASLLSSVATAISHGPADDTFRGGRRSYHELELAAMSRKLSITCKPAAEFLHHMLAKHAAHLGVRGRVVSASAFPSTARQRHIGHHWLLEVFNSGLFPIHVSTGGTLPAVPEAERRWILVDIDHKALLVDARSLRPLSLLEVYRRATTDAELARTVRFVPFAADAPLDVELDLSARPAMPRDALTRKSLSVMSYYARVFREGPPQEWEEPLQSFRRAHGQSGLARVRITDVRRDFRERMLLGSREWTRLLRGSTLHHFGAIAIGGAFTCADVAGRCPASDLRHLRDHPPEWGREGFRFVDMSAFEARFYASDA